MFEQLFIKLKELGSHHQILFTIIVAFSAICLTWAVERILDHYLFKKKALQGYLAVIIIALFSLWLIQHFILHVI